MKDYLHLVSDHKPSRINLEIPSGDISQYEYFELFKKLRVLASVKTKSFDRFRKLLHKLQNTPEHNYCHGRRLLTIALDRPHRCVDY